MGCAASIVVTVALLFIETGCRPAPEAPPPAIVEAIPPASVQPAPPVPSEQIRQAAKQILSITCGCSVADPGFMENTRILKAAGPTMVPVLAEMVPDKDLSVSFVGNAASTAAVHPFSEVFREALRGRRDDLNFQHAHLARQSVFDYFAAFGDSADLAWMESVAGSLEEDCRPRADKSIGELRRRLGK